MIGQTLGPYQVVAKLGEGGMGEVYRARDTRLNRDVALKILPDTFASDPDRIARFTREAQTLASLNHPHIAQIYSVEGGTSVPPMPTALVMELVDGETLAERIERGPIPLDEALPIARQIAEALEAAHEAGIIHRDLKPANIKVRPDGTVKVLDFGLAKALDPIASNAPRPESPTITTPAMTQAGLILGTAAYMSPEQAKGKAVDRRTDIWAFGCVLFEMLAGTPPFKSETVTEILAHIIRADPDWTALPSDTPRPIMRLLARALEKDARARLSHVGTARFLLDESGLTDSERLARKTNWRAVASAIAAAVVLAIASAAIAWALKPAPPERPKPTRRFQITLPDDQSFTRFGRHGLALSPDGQTLVYVANQQLYVRSLDSFDAVPISGTGEDPAEPVFSPDGSEIAYWANGQLKRISVSGGLPVTIYPAMTPLGMSWSAHGLLFGQPDGIYEVKADGGTPTRIIANDSKTIVAAPRRVGADAILFTKRAAGTDWDTAEIVLWRSDGSSRVLITGGTDAHRVGGHLIFVRGDTLYGVSVDPDSLAPLGNPVLLVRNISVGSPSGAGQFAVAGDGTLAYVQGGSSLGRQLAWVTRDGKQHSITTEPKNIEYPRLSPDTSKVAADIGGDIWVWHFDREIWTRITFEEVDERDPLWSPDGAHIIYNAQTDRGVRVFSKPANGGGTAVPLSAAFATGRALSLSPDGRRLLLRGTADSRARPGIGAGGDLMILDLGDGNTPRPLIATEAAERSGSISPNGKWLAYDTNESGRSEVYVVPLENPERARWQVSTAGGLLPQWSRDGKELYYLTPNRRMNTVSVIGADALQFGKPQALFDASLFTGGGYGQYYDAAPDGRFLMVLLPGFTEDRAIRIVENWISELEAKVTAR